MERQELLGAEGVRWVPERASGTGALVLAGSSGRLDSARAELLARHGAVAESIRWFGGSGQHEGPWEIAIELFLSRVEELSKVCDRIIAADQVRPDPVLLIDVLDRINNLQDGLTFEDLTHAAGAEVRGVWACRSHQATVASDVDWPALGESFTMQLLRRGIERER